jgi:hypothetical protein
MNNNYTTKAGDVFLPGTVIIRRHYNKNRKRHIKKMLRLAQGVLTALAIKLLMIKK